MVVVSLVLLSAVLFSLVFSILVVSQKSCIRLSSCTFFFANLLIFFLMYLYLLSDFSFYVVLLNSYSLQTTLYKVFGVWCSHEGSILFWLWCFSLYVFLVSVGFRKLSVVFYQLYFLLSLILYIYILLFSNPFFLLHFFAPEGLELSFILHNPLVSIHPPILYVGYLFTAWIFVYIIFYYYYVNTSWWRMYHLYLFVFLSFFLLSCGILLGSFWAYHELGWGGWWYWDAIENLAYLPWLVLLFVLHYVKLALKQSSTFLLPPLVVLYSFLIVVVGTFFLRSGNLDSIHNFVVDFSRGYVLLVFVVALLLICFLVQVLLPSYSGNMLSETLAIRWSLNIYVFTFLLCLLGYLCCIYWLTFYAFFVKIFLSKTLVVPSFFFNVITLSLVAVSIVFFFVSYLKYDVSLLVVVAIFFTFVSAKFLCLFAAFSVIFFLAWALFFSPSHLLTSFSLHWWLALAIFVQIISSFFSFEYFFSISYFELVSLGLDYYCCLGPKLLLKNNYFISSVYPLYIFYGDNLINVVYLEKSLFFNSSSFFIKPDILNFLGFDIYFVTGQSSESSTYLKVYIKFFMLFFWLVIIMFVILSTIKFYLSNKFLRALVYFY